MATLGKMYTPHELAEIFQVPLETIRDWRSKGYGPIGHRYGRHVRYPHKEVEAYMTDPELYQDRRDGKVA